MSSDIGGRLTDEQVQALAQLPPETIERLGDVADKLDGRSRREILAMLGGAGVAAGGLAYGVGSATADPDGDPGVMGQQNDRLDAWIDQADANEVDTDEVDITNETLIRALGDAEVTGVAAQTFSSPSFGNVPKDERNEFSSSQFTPDKAGWYLIIGTASIASSPGDQDRLESQLYNISDSTVTFRGAREPTSGTHAFQSFPTLHQILNLEGGKTYEYQVRNLDSSFDIDDASAAFNARYLFR